MIQITYGVTLSCYRHTSGSTRLTPIIHGEAEADSAQDAVYSLMERHGLTYVDRVEVTLPDGALWQRDQVLYKNTYNVAIWKTGKQSELCIAGDYIQADSPLLAALCLMQQNKLTYGASVSVRCPDGSIWRKSHLKIRRDLEGETHE